MRKWSVPDVVKQCCYENQFALLGGHATIDNRVQAIEHSTGRMHHAYGMCKACVTTSRKDQICHAELLDATQSLKLSRVNQIKKQPICVCLLEGNYPVDGILNDLRPIAHGFTGSLFVLQHLFPQIKPNLTTIE